MRFRFGTTIRSTWAAAALAWKNAAANQFRSWTVFISAALMAGFAVSATIVIGGAQRSLQLALQRLGADIIVVPQGTEDLMENAFLMGVPVKTWMPAGNLDRIRQVPGVQTASPQMFLSTLRGASCCSVPEMFLVAYDPETDFTLRPWLESHLGEGLATGQAVGGAFVYLPADQDLIYVYGYGLDLKGNLEPTGTGIDASMFFTFETAREIARLSPFQAVEEMVIPEDSISAAMIKLEPGADPGGVADGIRQSLSGITAVESSNLFRSQHVQIMGLMQSVVALLGVAWLLLVSLVGLVFSMSVNERRQEIGVLRALGSTRRFVFESLLAEGLILALGGALAGIAFFAFGVYLFRHIIITSMGVPFLFPSIPALLLLGAAGAALTLLSVALGALVPTVRISVMDPALAMRK